MVRGTVGSSVARCTRRGALATLPPLVLWPRCPPCCPVASQSDQRGSTVIQSLHRASIITVEKHIDQTSWPARRCCSHFTCSSEMLHAHTVQPLDFNLSFALHSYSTAQRDTVANTVQSVLERRSLTVTSAQPRGEQCLCLGPGSQRRLERSSGCTTAVSVQTKLARQLRPAHCAVAHSAAMISVCSTAVAPRSSLLIDSPLLAQPQQR